MLGGGNVSVEWRGNVCFKRGNRARTHAQLENLKDWEKLRKNPPPALAEEMSCAAVCERSRFDHQRRGRQAEIITTAVRAAAATTMICTLEEMMMAAEAAAVGRRLDTATTDTRATTTATTKDTATATTTATAPSTTLPSTSPPHTQKDSPVREMMRRAKKIQSDSSHLLLLRRRPLLYSQEAIYNARHCAHLYDGPVNDSEISALS